MPAETNTNEVSRRVLLALPSHDFRYDVAVLSGLLPVLAAGAGAIRPYFSCGDSNIAHHRNTIAHYFKTKARDCQTLVWVDSDIGFTLEDFTYLMEGDEDLVIAPYSHKNDSGRSIEWGMGFVRVERRVFEVLDAWMTTAPEGDGEIETLRRFFLDGELATDYFYNGALPDMRWQGEDTGFFHWCSMVGSIRLRMEKRTRLTHFGRRGYTYPPAGAPLEDGAQ
jgi:hypothetical protein